MSSDEGQDPPQVPHWIHISNRDTPAVTALTSSKKRRLGLALSGGDTVLTASGSAVKRHLLEPNTQQKAGTMNGGRENTHGLNSELGRGRVFHIMSVNCGPMACMTLSYNYGEEMTLCKIWFPNKNDELIICLHSIPYPTSDRCHRTRCS
jgi:hypothetical protein